MEYKDTKRRDETDEIIDDLISIPIKNLERKIREIESEIEIRIKLLDGALLNLNNQKQRLEEDIVLLHYTPGFEFAIDKKIRIKNEITRMEIRKLDEKISNFRDVSKLKEKLQLAKEEIEVEKVKRKLIES